MSARNSIVNFALTQLGIVEEPPRSNQCKFNNWYYPEGHAYFKNSKPYAWCGTCVAYLYHFGGKILPLALHKCIGWVPAARDWLAENAVEGENNPADIVIFDWNRDGFEEHIGILYAKKGDYYYCIEGNTAPNILEAREIAKLFPELEEFIEQGIKRLNPDGLEKSESNGGSVWIKKRHKKLVEGVYNVID